MPPLSPRTVFIVRSSTKIFVYAIKTFLLRYAHPLRRLYLTRPIAHVYDFCQSGKQKKKITFCPFIIMSLFCTSNSLNTLEASIMLLRGCMSIHTQLLGYSSLLFIRILSLQPLGEYANYTTCTVLPTIILCMPST